MSTKTQTRPTPVPTYTTTIDVGSFENIPFRFTFHTDGTGLAVCQQYGDDDEQVKFTWDPSILDTEDGEIEDILSEHAQNLFWDTLNEQLDDQVLSSEDFGSDEVVFESGSSEELERMVRHILYSFPDLWEDDREDIDVVIRTRGDNYDAQIDEYCELMEDADISDDTKSGIRELVELCLQWIDPYGWSLEYNDGAYGRASGYDESANTLDYTISRPSFHELAEARPELLKLFAQHDLEEAARSHLPEEGD